MPPTMRRPALLAASTFARFTEQIRESRCFVSSWVCHRTPFGVASIRSENAVLRTGGGGRRHHPHPAVIKRVDQVDEPARHVAPCRRQHRNAVDHDGMEFARQPQVVGRRQRRFAQVVERKTCDAHGGARHVQLAPLDEEIERLDLLPLEGLHRIAPHLHDRADRVHGRRPYARPHPTAAGACDYQRPNRAFLVAGTVGAATAIYALAANDSAVAELAVVDASKMVATRQHSKARNKMTYEPKEREILKLRHGLEDESPAVRGSALVSVQQLSKDSPGLVNSMRPLLHTLAIVRRNSGNPGATARPCRPSSARRAQRRSRWVAAGTAG